MRAVRAQMATLELAVTQAQEPMQAALLQTLGPVRMVLTATLAPTVIPERAQTRAVQEAPEMLARTVMLVAQAQQVTVER